MAKHKAIRGDCIEELHCLEGKVALITADPPYNIGQLYADYDDTRAEDEYHAWTRDWLDAAWEALKPSGSLWVFCPDEWVSEIDMYCRRSLKMTKRRHVIWAFTFGQKATKNFTRSHCHLLYLSKSKTRFTFNADAVKVPSARQLVYNDKRAVKGGKPPDATWMLLKDQLEPYMTPDTDTWLQSRVCGTYKEREPHSPNQIPVPLMERIVLACSDKGDLVVDPFAGSCASGVACALHGREWLGFDISETCVRLGNLRIKGVLKR